MCRLVAYLGRQMLLENVLVAPKNSIVMQSLRARESELRTNGDGFGLAWYAPEIDSTPALFTSIYPAWNDRNLLNLTAKIQSPCFFAHVRAASASGVSTNNCHPFIHGDWMFMHNGEIHDFLHIKRHLRHLLDDDIYNWIKGETDSEHFFALFMQLAKGHDFSQLSVVGEVLQETIRKIEGLIKEHCTKGVSYYNLCISDGHRLIATRYCSSTKRKAESLHYSVGYVLPTRRQWEKEVKNRDYIVVSSEKLNDLEEGWENVPADTMLLVDEKKNIQLIPLTIT